MPIFLASKSPNVLVIASPGPSTSYHTRKGPQGSFFSLNILSINPPEFLILSFSEDLVGL